MKRFMNNYLSSFVETPIYLFQQVAGKSHLGYWFKISTNCEMVQINIFTNEEKFIKLT